MSSSMSSLLLFIINNESVLHQRRRLDELRVDEAGIIKTLCLHRLLLLSLTVLATVEAEVVDGVVEEDGEGTDEDEIDQVVIPSRISY